MPVTGGEGRAWVALGVHVAREAARGRAHGGGRPAASGGG
jgi:hypothetical protein